MSEDSNSKPVNTATNNTVDDTNTSDSEEEKIEGLKYNDQITYVNTYDEAGNLTTSAVGQASSEKQSESYFSGYLIDGQASYEDSIIKLNASRVINSASKNELITAPWDWRLGTAYTNTQSIGNSMPAGPEWVGSPSIMNPYALIRFGHVASLKQNIDLIDQKGRTNFRSGGVVRKNLTANEKDSDKIQVGSDATENDVKEKGVGEGDKKVTISDSETKQKYKISDNDDLWQDANTGAIYNLVLDVTQKTIYLKNKDANCKKVVKEGDKYEIKEVKIYPDVTEFQVPTKDDYGKDIDYKPNTLDFWLKRNNLKKCGDILKIGFDYYGDDGDGEGSCEAVKKSVADDKNKVKIAKKDEAATIFNSINKNVPSDGDAWAIKDSYNKQYILTDDFDQVLETILEPTIDNLCDPSNWSGKEQYLYNYYDFLYTTYFGLIPNNYLVTLRRFPNPVTDNAMIFGQSSSGNFTSPIAKAVTWLGEDTGNKLENIAGFGWKYNWREIASSINEVQGNEQGPENTPFGGLGKALGIISSIASGGAGFSKISGWDEQRAKFDPYKDGMYANRIYGPVNVIAKTKARERGLEFENSITVNFHYSLKSIGGVNPKAALIDVIANMLALTYSNADFWGGANRYFPNKPSYPFPGGKKGFQQWYSGDFTGFIDSLGEQIANVGGQVMDLVRGLMTNPREALNTLLSGAAKTWMAVKQKDKRPGILGFKATLTGDPVGEWHLMVGNPFNPLLTIGNLIVTNAKLKLSENFGVDDFPTDISFEITLEHGKPRDKGDIESMFNRGEGRLHYAPFGIKDEKWNVSSATKDSRIDTSWKSKGKSKSKSDNNGDTINKVSNTAKKFYNTNTENAAKLGKLFFK
jgi:hypothetical protein